MNFKERKPYTYMERNVVTKMLFKKVQKSKISFLYTLIYEKKLRKNRRFVEIVFLFPNYNGQKVLENIYLNFKLFFICMIN